MFSVEKDMASQRPGEAGLGGRRLPSRARPVGGRLSGPDQRRPAVGGGVPGEAVEGGAHGLAAGGGEPADGGERVLDVGGDREQRLVVLGENGSPGLGRGLGGPAGGGSGG